MIQGRGFVLKELRGWIPALFSSILYITIAYFTHRSQFALLFLQFSLLFGVYFFWVIRINNEKEITKALRWAVFFRLFLLSLIPNLSDDYFRFLWDGQLLLRGYNPYVHLPKDLIIHFPENNYLNTLYQGMNSPAYYSIYPPVLQLIFFFSSLGGEYIFVNVLILRFFILMGEFLNLYLIFRLLEILHLPAKNILWYALNPLVILELTGNLHFEALMITGLLLTIWYISKEKLIPTALGLTFGVGIKLLPLIALPFFIKRLGRRRFVLLVSLTFLMQLLLFLPFFHKTLPGGLGNSIGLYFQKFEFNASFYYLLRWVGYGLLSYNPIHTLGKILPLIVFILILYLAYREKNTEEKSLSIHLLLGFSIYFLFATTVHPWYLTTLVMFATLTHFHFPILWSFLAFLSYQTYAVIPYRENLWLTGLEYILLCVYLVYEIFMKPGFMSEKRHSGSRI